jgi:nitroreductase
MEFQEVIRNRKSVYPTSYLPEVKIDKNSLELILENAQWAPTHKLSMPWRFVVFHSPESRLQLSTYLADFYRTHTQPEVFSADKMEKIAQNPLKSGAVIAICMLPDPTLPEFEEIAATAMAVQNMWLTCTNLHLGCYWSTPQAALHAQTFLQLEPTEKCLGLFYIGHYQAYSTNRQRPPLSERTRWK